MLLSILHRATGLAMAFGLIVFAVWLVQAAAGPEQYQRFRALIAHPLGIALLVGWTFAFFMHLGNGIRHLVMDNGFWFEKRQATASAWFVIAFAAIMTAAVWMTQL